jgi:cell division protein FtsB
VKPLHYPLIGLLLLLQYPLWFGSASATEVMRLQHQVAEQKAHNLSLQERNEALKADVKNLKSGMEAIEERARLELGMIRPGETFYQVVEPGK